MTFFYIVCRQEKKILVSLASRILNFFRTSIRKQEIKPKMGKQNLLAYKIQGVKDFSFVLFPFYHSIVLT